MTLCEVLRKLDACSSAREWAGGLDPSEAWETCQRGDWLLWVLCMAGADWREVITAVCDCVAPAMSFVPAGEDRPARALAASRAVANGNGTVGANAACYAAANAAANAARYAARYAAANAANAAANAARYAAAHAAADAADAAVHAAAHAAGAAANAAANAAGAAANAACYAAGAAANAACYAAAYAAADAKQADIIRKRFPWEKVGPLYLALTGEAK